jgi:hypothetical protein
MKPLYAVTHLGRYGPIYSIATLGGLNRAVRLVVAAAAMGSAWILGTGGVGRTIVVGLLAALALTVLLTAATGFCPTRTFVGWRVRLVAADYLGCAIAWLFAGGRLVLLSLVATAAAVLFLPIQWWEGVLGWSITALFVAAMRAKVRVVIENFDDYRAPASAKVGAAATAGEEGKAESGSDNYSGNKEAVDGKDAGTAVLLANRLATMRELYGFVDDPDRTPTPDRPARATIQLDDPSSVLRSAVTTESTVSFGGVTIPLGAAMSLLGRLVQAPRLRGAIHGDEHSIVVTAELVMDGQPYAWRVPKEGEDAGRAGRTLEGLITDELAYQVFSDLTLQRQARWPATRFWVLALERMAECQRRQRNRRLLYNEAESHFRQALAEDERFYLACLNLGIVYRRLAERQPAERGEDYMLAARGVFEWAVRMCPDRWEAYHALAEAHWEKYRMLGTGQPERQGLDGAFEMIAGLCVRALSRKPDRAARARILDLQGQAETAAARRLNGDGKAEADSFRDALDSRRSACWLAMSELARTRLRCVSPTQASRLRTLENLASQCLVNLGRTAREAHVAGQDGGLLIRAVPPRDPYERRRTLRDRRVFRAGRRLATLAVYLADVDAVAHQRLAEFAYRNGRLDIAADELSAAARIAPADPRYGAHRAFVLAKNEARERALAECARAEQLIDFGDLNQQEAQEWLIAAHRALGRDDYASKLETRTGLATELDALHRNRNYTVQALRALLTSCESAGGDWEAARVRMKLGHLILSNIPLQPGPGTPEAERKRQTKEAEDLFRQALDWFRGQHPSDKRLADLHSGVAQALVRRPADRDKALREAERAMILAPLEARHRSTLSCVYEVGGDLNSACSAADEAVLLDPDDPGLHHRSAMLRWQLAEALADPAAHMKERKAASTRFEETLKLYDSENRRERRTTSWWLAMSYFAMSEFEQVPAHLQFVLASIPSGRDASHDDRALTAAAELWLAKSYRKLGKYGRAKDQARRAVDAALQLRADGVPLTKSVTDAVDDKRWPLWIVLALSHLQLAGCHTDRAGSVDRAAGSLANVREVFTRLERSGIDFRETDTYAEYLAETGRFLLATDKASAAITALRGSVGVDPDEADVYLLLARAHARAAEQEVEADWQAHIRGGRAACRHTIEIGGKDHPDAREAADVEKQLNRLEAEASGRSTAWAGDGTPPPEFGGTRPSPTA